ncbi:FMN-dependent NADH-azoreductase [Chitinophaga rupis]|uniref:FMN dependent NADH:quinone oxidoreductase n=1 Tax=Chitinophaga rupis TaxID=573321 RepID=A0A1H8G7X4_9BACT|nr:NAD(P)H-dependent oxidoreductase [Chitinophaga rupis]SEN39969.1 FMN-dependent NADH-azoreductase [Chitinophaga rupis]
MKKILSVISSARSKASNSIRLQQEIIDKLQARYPESTVTVRDLVANKYPHLEESHLTAFYVQEENDSPEYRLARTHSEQAIREIEEADILVIGVPIYNFSIPSALKAWIDHIVRSRKTFTVVDGRPEGLVKNKKVYLAIASGGVFSDGPYKAWDFTEPYLRHVLGFIGLTDITVFRAEGFSVPGVQDVALQKGIESVAV